MKAKRDLGRVCVSCPTIVTDNSPTGRCRPCMARKINADPNVVQRTPETEARRIAALVEANRRRIHIPWLPREYHAEYRNMIRNRRFKAAEARAIIEAQMKADERKLSPFERQERALRAGATLQDNAPITRWSPAADELRKKLG